MKKIFKSRIFLVILTAIITTSIIGVSASILYQANEIGFTPRNSNWKVNNLESALNDLYENKGGSYEDFANKFYWIFDYTGGEQEFAVPVTGTYKLEVWGAQGGDASKKNGGLGGYSIGNIHLDKDSTLYINVGGSGVNNCSSTCNGGYNGGGLCISNASRGSGGGATHIATKTGELKNLGYEDAITNSKLLIVAGGGGGAGYYSDVYSAPGGAGGGTNGIDGQSYQATGSSAGLLGKGATQENAGIGQTSGSFGKGADANNSNNGGAGGGGGFYGGGSSSNAAGAGGGSGYVGGVINGQTIAGNSEMPTHNGQSTMTGNSGNGFAKITYVGN